MKKIKFFFALIIFLAVCVIAIIAFKDLNPKDLYKDWKIYGGSNSRIQYSALNQIDTNNVQSLQMAWIYHTKDAEGSSQMQANTILVDGVLYGVSPRLKLVALDPESNATAQIRPAADRVGHFAVGLEELVRGQRPSHKAEPQSWGV